IDFSRDERKLGGSSLAQVLNLLGNETPTIKDDAYFVRAFNAVQQLIKQEIALAGHDISEGGLITALLEMAFSVPDVVHAAELGNADKDIVRTMFSENPGVLLQVADESSAKRILSQANVDFVVLGKVTGKRSLNIRSG